MARGSLKPGGQLRMTTTTDAYNARCVDNGEQLEMPFATPLRGRYNVSQSN